MIWQRVDERRWRRNDGAAVWVADASSGRPDGRIWIASGPGRGETMRRRMRCDRAERFTPVRRFSTALAAMAAVDAEFPLQGSLSLL